MSETTYPTQYEIDNISIDGEDIMGLFMNMEIYENIFIPLVTGSITFLDTDGGGFVEEKQIEFNEEFGFTIRSASGDTMNFKGVLNGVQSEVSQGNKKVYTVDFTSAEMRENDQTFINERIDDTPQAIIQKMIEKIGGEIEVKGSEGKRMEMVASRWKPLHVNKYVLTHGVGEKATATEEQKNQDEEAKGTTGYLCWQVIGEGKNKYRFCGVDDLLEGVWETHEPLENKLNMRGAALEEQMNSIIEYNFKSMGDIQTKMKSGAFRSINVSFDMDKGLYKEYEYNGEELMTDKQKGIVKKPTRILMKPFNNEKFEKSCDKAPDNTHDQSREYLSQNNARQNSFNDQTGSVTCYAQFKVHAGDLVELKINKVVSGDSKGTGENRKHSGKYVVKQIGHHFSSDGRAFSKITTIRSSTQQDKTSST